MNPVTFEHSEEEKERINAAVITATRRAVMAETCTADGASVLAFGHLFARAESKRDAEKIAKAMNERAAMLSALEFITRQQSPESWNQACAAIAQAGGLVPSNYRATYEPIRSTILHSPRRAKREGRQS